MNKKLLIAGAGISAALLAAMTLLAPEKTDTASTDGTGKADGAPMVTVTLPETLSAEATMGKRGFDAKCAACHGANAAGSGGVAPPLIHKIYEPSHHGDESFQVAVARGVRAHHWTFGNMAPVDGLTRADVTAIISYIREVQHANGIF